MTFSKGSSEPQLFLIEVKTMRGEWVPYTTSEREDRAYCRRVIKAQGATWADSREWRVVPNVK